jgi:hypothetical protein
MASFGETPPPPHAYRTLIPHADDDDFGAQRKHIPGFRSLGSLTSPPLATDRHSGQGSTLTDTSMHDSLFSKLSEAEGFITEPARTNKVDHLVSLFKNKSGLKRLLNLERDKAQKYADILDAVRYSIT